MCIRSIPLNIDFIGVPGIYGVFKCIHGICGSAAITTADPVITKNAIRIVFVALINVLDAVNMITAWAMIWMFVFQLMFPLCKSDLLRGISVYKNHTCLHGALINITVLTDESFDALFRH